MQPKPPHLGEEYGAQFSDASVAAAYPLRPPYPPTIFARFVELLAPGNRAVLDPGCGTGDLARPLAPLVERVDAVDLSAPMLAVGRSSPGGDHPNLCGIKGRAVRGRVPARQSSNGDVPAALSGPRLPGLMAVN